MFVVARFSGEIFDTMRCNVSRFEVYFFARENQVFFLLFCDLKLTLLKNVDPNLKVILLKVQKEHIIIQPANAINFLLFLYPTEITYSVNKTKVEG